MQARYYDPVIGRFYSNDPISFRGIHSFNRYAYANNNPYKYIDPTGMMSCATGEDGIEHCPTIAQRPDSGSFWRSYMYYETYTSKGYTKNDVWRAIGGTLGASQMGENSCAARISLALIGCDGGFEFSEDVTWLNSGGDYDGLRFIIRAADLEKNLILRWGTPDYQNVTSEQILAISDSLVGNQVAIIVSPEHATVLKQGYRDKHFLLSEGGSAWILPTSDK
jgi:hypothetical protein